ncbi:hypothetical protein E1301_Tti020308 [Triplophysa tibetana]|uniref:Uncharacterized protein n=1 Tax=Triplophysa tibetana TaxID=1572043 RepID=A0A5A9NXQ0_9TELE|nr:hypothetical protein E1301_Tti020308 [Triplophysa tibetana]
MALYSPHLHGALHFHSPFHPHAKHPSLIPYQLYFRLLLIGRAFFRKGGKVARGHPRWRVFTATRAFIPGERIEVEYLLAQSNRGNQLIAHRNDMPKVPPEEPEDEIDTTVCHAADLRADDSSSSCRLGPGDQSGSSTAELQAPESEEQLQELTFTDTSVSTSAGMTDQLI